MSKPTTRSHFPKCGALLMQSRFMIISYDNLSWRRKRSWHHDEVKSAWQPGTRAFTQQPLGRTLPLLTVASRLPLESPVVLIPLFYFILWPNPWTHIKNCCVFDSDGRASGLSVCPLLFSIWGASTSHLHLQLMQGVESAATLVLRCDLWGCARQNKIKPRQRTTFGVSILYA